MTRAPWWTAQQTPSVRRSLIAERKSARTQTAAGGLLVLPDQVVSLINWQDADDHATVQRVTLQPLRRVDGKQSFIHDLSGQELSPPVVPGNPAGWAYNRTSAQNFVALPDRGAFVHMTWGVAGVTPNDVVADWPEAGCSFDVLCSRLTVDAVVPQTAPFVFDEGAAPVFAAEVGPSDPINRRFEQLSFTQQINGIDDGATVALAVPWYAQSVELSFSTSNGIFVTDTAIAFLEWRHFDGAIEAQQVLPCTSARIAAGINTPARPYELPVVQQSALLAITFAAAGDSGNLQICAEWRIAL